MSHFEIVRPLGTGGLGDVYLARDRLLERPVALKLFRRSIPGASLELQLQAQAMGKLHHPSIATVYGVGVHEGETFVAMEYIDGVNLAEWLDDLGRRTEDRVAHRESILAAFDAAGHGLSAAHAAGIVHGDFKPRNVMRAKDGRIAVIDFGMGASEPGREDDSPGPAKQLFGTPRYMAPEQLAGGPASPASDQYAFCVALGEALFLESPVDPEIHDLASRYTALVEGGPAVPGAGAKGRWARRVHRVLRRGLSLDPRNRYPSLDALLRDLPAPDRRRVWSIGAGVFLGVLAAAALHFGWQSQRIRNCEANRRAQFEAVYDESTAQRIERQLHATGLSYAGDTADRVRARLDAHQRGLQAHVAAWCVAADEPSAVQSSCLRESLSSLREVVEILETTDRTSLAFAIPLVDSLPDIEDCLERVDDGTPLSERDDPVAVQARQDLREARNLGVMGQLDEARAVLEGALEDVDAAKYPQERIDLHLNLGFVLSRIDTPAASMEQFEQAILVAEASGDIEDEIEGWTNAAWVAALRMQDSELAEDHLAHAEALLQRVPNRRLVRLNYLNRSATVLAQRGEPQAAAAQFRQAIELSEREHGAHHPQTANYYNNLGVMEYRMENFEVAVANYRKALELRQRTYGEGDPRVSTYHFNLGSALSKSGRHVQALEQYRRALSIRQSALGPTHPQVARTLSTIATELRELGRYRDAIRHVERAISMSDLENRAPDDPKVGSMCEVLDQILDAAGQEKLTLVPAQEVRARCERVRAAAKGQPIGTVGDPGPEDRSTPPSD